MILSGGVIDLLGMAASPQFSVIPQHIYFPDAFPKKEIKPRPGEPDGVWGVVISRRWFGDFVSRSDCRSHRHLRRTGWRKLGRQSLARRA